MSMTEDRLAQIIEDNSEVVGHTVPNSDVAEGKVEDVGIDKEIVSDPESVDDIGVDPKLVAEIGIELGLGDDEISSDEFKSQVEELFNYARWAGITDVLGFVKNEVKEDRYRASENPFAFLRSRILLLMEFEKMIKKTRGNKNSD